MNKKHVSCISHQFHLLSLVYDGLAFLSSNVVYKELMYHLKNQNGKFIPIVVDEKDNWTVIPSALSTLYWYRWPLDKQTKKLLCHLRKEPEIKPPPVNVNRIPIRPKYAKPRR